MKRADDRSAGKGLGKSIIDIDEFRAVLYRILKDSNLFIDRSLEFSAPFAAAARHDHRQWKTVPTRGDGFSWVVQVIEADFDAVCSGQVRGKDFVQTPWSERNAQRAWTHHFKTTAPC